VIASYQTKKLRIIADDIQFEQYHPTMLFRKF